MSTIPCNRIVIDDGMRGWMGMDCTYVYEIVDNDMWYEIVNDQEIDDKYKVEEGLERGCLQEIEYQIVRTSVKSNVPIDFSKIKKPIKK